MASLCSSPVLLLVLLAFQPASAALVPPAKLKIPLLSRAPVRAPRRSTVPRLSEEADDDPYKVLQVERGATPEQIRKAFRQRAKGVHPDVSDLPDAADSFQRLVRAFNRLLEDEQSDQTHSERSYNASYDSSVKQRAAERARRAWRRTTDQSAPPQSARTRRQTEDTEVEASQRRRKRWREVLFEEVCRDCMPLGSSLSAVQRAAFIRSLEQVVRDYSSYTEAAVGADIDELEIIEQLTNREVLQVELADSRQRLQLHRERARALQDELSRAERKAELWRHASPASVQTMERELAFLELSARLRGRLNEQRQAIERLETLSRALAERLEGLPPRTV